MPFHHPEFETNSNRYTLYGIQSPKDIMDTPAEAIILSISAENAAELSDQQIKYLKLYKFVGITQLIVCITNMGNKQVEYPQNIFITCKQNIHASLKQIGFVDQEIKFIPICA